MVQEVVVEGDITLGQFLKTEGIIESGGQAKWFLQDVEVLMASAKHVAVKLANQDRIDFPDIPEIDSVIIIHQGEQ